STWSLDSPGLALSLVTVAVFTTGESATLSLVVGEVLCTVRVSPGAMSPKSQDSTATAIPQSAAPVPPSMDQDVPASVGSTSETCTPWAVAVPSLVTVMVKPIAVPQ